MTVTVAFGLGGQLVQVPVTAEHTAATGLMITPRVDRDPHTGRPEPVPGQYRVTHVPTGTKVPAHAAGPDSDESDEITDRAVLRRIVALAAVAGLTDWRGYEDGTPAPRYVVQIWLDATDQALTELSAPTGA